MVTREQCLKLFDYKDGKLIRKTSPRNNARKGSEAGWEMTCGKLKYRSVQIEYKSYLAHRIIWLMEKGYWPETIDHIDGNGLNNKIENLRDVKFKENLKNRTTQSNSNTGISGVTKRGGKWRVRINDNKTRINIGNFSDFFEACCARKSAERGLDYHLNHGRC